MSNTNLKEFLKRNGRSQVWLRDELAKKGIIRDPATISQWCTGKVSPKDEYVYKAIAEILQVTTDKIKSLLS